MIDSFGNMPSHPLLVHIPVVLVPLSLLGIIVMVALPRLQRHYAIPTTVVAAVAFLGSILAADSGRSLEASFTAAGQTIPTTLQDHIDMGSTPQYLAALMLALLVAWAILLRRPTDHDVSDDGTTPGTSRWRCDGLAASALGTRWSWVMMAATIIAAAMATLSVLRTGHSGAASVWEQVNP